MKKPNKMPLIMVFFGLISISCTTTNKQGSSKVITIQDIEQIHLGTHADQVLQMLGEPAEKEEVHAKNQGPPEKTKQDIEAIRNCKSF